MSGSWWTAERTHKLRDLYSKGISNRQIATIMGAASRSVIINKVARLRLNDGTARVEQAAKAAAVAKDRRNSGIGAQVQKINRGRPGSTVGAFVGAETDVSSRRQLLVDMGAFECRYPDAEGNPEAGVPHTFCGHAVIIGKSYCAAHAALVRGAGTPAERSAVPARLLRESAA